MRRRNSIKKTMKPDSAGHQRIRIDLSDRDMQEFNKK
jgi:hypothetical protein